jgi:hypothetical protein
MEALVVLSTFTAQVLKNGILLVKFNKPTLDLHFFMWSLVHYFDIDIVYHFAVTKPIVTFEI